MTSRACSVNCSGFSTISTHLSNGAVRSVRPVLIMIALSLIRYHSILMSRPICHTLERTLGGVSDYALRGRLAERRLIIDLHTHTHPASDDSSMTLDELVLRAREAGLDGVCVTDHDRFLDADEARRVSEAHGLLVLPGSEVTTDEGHLLVFG